MAYVTNNGAGPRYFFAKGAPVTLQPGETSDQVDLSKTDVDAIEMSGDLSISDKPAAAGPSGKRVFLALADDAEGANFRVVDTGTAQFAGFAIGEVAPSDPADFNFRPLAAESDEEDDDGLDEQTVSELKTLASAEDIDLGDATKKADIVEAIRAARAAKTA